MMTLVRQPFTWALVVLTVALDLIFFGSESEDLTAWLVTGQMLAAGGWLVLGQGPRLLRGALFVAAIVGVAWLQQITYPPITGPSGEVMEGITVDIFGPALALNSCLAGSTAVFTLLWVVALSWRGRRQGVAVDGGAWRFRLSEILGWTVIVAAASAIMRLADAEILPAEVLAPLAIFSLTAALLMALFARRDARVRPASVVLAAAAVAALVGALSLIEPEFNREGLTMIAGAYGYVVAWIVLQRLDLRWTRLRRQPRAEPPKVAISLRETRSSLAEREDYCFSLS